MMMKQIRLCRESVGVSARAGANRGFCKRNHYELLNKESHLVVLCLIGTEHLDRDRRYKRALTLVAKIQESPRPNVND
jgi:hypothetical protein